MSWPIAAIIIAAIFAAAWVLRAVVISATALMPPPEGQMQQTAGFAYVSEATSNAEGSIVPAAPEPGVEPQRHLRSVDDEKEQE